MRKIDLIVIHCSATRADRDYSPLQLERDHRLQGFTTTGYHFYIRKDGEIITCRPLRMPGAHVKGYNAHSIGVCYEGGLTPQGQPADTRTAAQRRALRIVVRALLMDYSDARVVGHRDLSPDLNGNGVIEP
ncbi:MAG: N-acetylmuramoyl-L-alanine amidase [Bacteroides sp.]|nr:N-acetylmuramoyl-L-alanine amidase [Bacteroides sp.]